MSEYTKRARSIKKDEQEAIQDIIKQLHQNNIAGVIFFCSRDYNLEAIEKELDKYFDCPVLGCTTAGELNPNYVHGSIVATSFSSEKFVFHIQSILDVKNFNTKIANEQIKNISNNLKFNDTLDDSNMFTFLLNDGTSMCEEKITAMLYQAMEEVSIIGGTAGDNFQFTSALVYADKKFRDNCSCYALIETKLDFDIFQLQHFEPTEDDIIVTRADPSARRVYEIDGENAADLISTLVGKKKENLTSKIYTDYPLLLQIGDQWHVRSMAKVMDDDSIYFACAIDEGIPLTIGRSKGLLDSLKDNVSTIQNNYKNIELTVGCDCAYRELEVDALNIKKEVSAELEKLNFIGFSTFGEQFNSVHVNQTLTCVVIGEK